MLSFFLPNKNTYVHMHKLALLQDCAIGKINPTSLFLSSNYFPKEFVQSALDYHGT